MKLYFRMYAYMVKLYITAGECFPRRGQAVDGLYSRGRMICEESLHVMNDILSLNTGGGQHEWAPVSLHTLQ